MDRHHDTGGRDRRRWVRGLGIAAVTAMVVGPAAAYASNTFTDVPDSNIFHDDIQWMADNEVTLGCNPPTNDAYCPKENVTREQMAAFMRRLETKGVFLTTDGKAADADLLDGKNGSHYATAVGITTGSQLDGDPISVQNGEAARMSITAPSAGRLLVRHTSSWDPGDYDALLWVERYDSTSPCDNIGDGDSVRGTIGTASLFGDIDFATVSGQGMSDVPSGTSSWSLCIDTRGGTSDNVEYSIAGEWVPSGVTTAAFDAPGTSGASSSGGSSDGVLAD